MKFVETFFEDYCVAEKFDVIIMGFILEHVESPKMILSKYIEMLNETGRMFIAVPNAEALNRRLGYLAGILEDTKKLSTYDIELGHKRYYSVETLKNECTSAGLEVVSIEGLFLKPFTTSQLLGLNLSSDIINALCEVGIEYPELSLGILAEVKRG